MNHMSTDTTSRKPATASADGILRDLYRQHADLQVRLDSCKRRLAGEFGECTGPNAAFTAGQADGLRTAIQQLAAIIESATR